MQYMLLFYEIPAEQARADDPEQVQAYWGAWNAYVGALEGSGLVRGGNGLAAPRPPPPCAW